MTTDGARLTVVPVGGKEGLWFDHDRGSMPLTPTDPREVLAEVGLDDQQGVELRRSSPPGT